jgi:hypothetical protein
MPRPRQRPERPGISFDDFRRIVYQHPDDRKPPSAESRLRAVAALLMLVAIVAGIAWIGVNALWRW